MLIKTPRTMLQAASKHSSTAIRSSASSLLIRFCNLTRVCSHQLHRLSSSPSPASTSRTCSTSLSRQYHSWFRNNPIPLQTQRQAEHRPAHQQVRYHRGAAAPGYSSQQGETVLSSSLEPSIPEATGMAASAQEAHKLQGKGAAEISEHPQESFAQEHATEDLMSESYGEGYSTRSSEEGFGGVYAAPVGGSAAGSEAVDPPNINRSVPHPRTIARCHTQHRPSLIAHKVVLWQRRRNQGMVKVLSGNTTSLIFGE